MIIGIPEDKYPSKNSIYVIVDLVLRIYGNHTDKEIRSAFELAASGDLDVPEHFNNFSFKYFSAVLNSWKIEVNKEMQEEMKSDVIEQPKFIGEVDWSDTLDFIIEQSKTQNINKMIIPSYLYDWMIKKRLINPTGEEKKEMFQKSLDRIMNELSSKYLNGFASNEDKALLRRLNDGFDKSSAEHTLISNEAKKMIVVNYIKTKQ